jgi:hypothetical protein
MDTTTNPDNFDIQPPPYHTPTQSIETLDTCITKNHYDRAVNRAPAGKATDPNAITNELIKNHSEAVHTIIYKLFLIMDEHIIYTPIEWCRSAT